MVIHFLFARISSETYLCSASHGTYWDTVCHFVSLGSQCLYVQVDAVMVAAAENYFPAVLSDVPVCPASDAAAHVTGN